jgi:2-hydroxychromene-2-carboxylate isomerase
LIKATLITDPGCPWAYSAEPAMQTLLWRYGDQLSWELAVIGLSESGQRYEERGYTPALMAGTPLRFARYGMPFAVAPRSRLIGTGRACRAIVSVRLSDPARARLALRALHFAWFTTPLLLDEDEAIASALSRVEGLDAAAAVARIDSDEVEEHYQRDRALARSAAGTAASLQGKTASSDGPERFTAPTLVLERDGQRLVAGGHQPMGAYDVLVANLDPTLHCEPGPEGPLPLLERFPHGLTTREIATMMAARNDEPDHDAAVAALIPLVAEGRVVREALGNDALWFPA